MRIWGVSGVYSRPVRLAVNAAFSFLFLSTTAAYAENDALKRLSDAVKDYRANAKELEKTDAFNVRLALRRAVIAERPGTPFRWNNLHTKHNGEIVLQDFVQPRRNGRVCVDFKHTYYLGGKSPIEDEGTVCRDNEDHWDDIIIRATFTGTGTAAQSPPTPRYNTKVVREIQDLLIRLNYDPGPIDGRYGERTRRAIEYYQRDEGLPITGRVSNELAASLRQSLVTLEALPSAPTPETAGGGPAEPSAAEDTSSPASLVSPTEESVKGSASAKTPLTDRTPSRTAIDSPHTDGGANLASQDSLHRDPAPDAVAIESSAADGIPKPITERVDSAALGETETLVTVAPKESAPVEVTAVDRKIVVLTIDGVDIDLLAQTQSMPANTKAPRKSDLYEALKPAWTVTDDWQHLPWSGTYADITKNITRAKNAIYRVYQAAATGGQQIVIATHGWGGVVAYRAILELHKEKKIPAGGIDVLVTMGAPLSAQADSARNAARKYAYWLGSRALAEPVRVWLNYWIKEDQSSGAIIGVAKNRQLPYGSSVSPSPHNAYQESSIFRDDIERDIVSSLQDPNKPPVVQQMESKVVDAALPSEENSAGKLIRPPIVQADAKPQNAQAGIDNKETELVQDSKQGGFAKEGESKNAINPTDFFGSGWFFAIIGLAFCGVVGAIIYRSLSSRVNGATDRRAQTKLATQELNSKIAVVAGQLTESAERANESVQTHGEVHRQPEEGAETSRTPEESTGLGEQRQREVALSSLDESDSLQGGMREMIREIIIDELSQREVPQEIVPIGKVEDALKRQLVEEPVKQDSQDAIVETAKEIVEPELQAVATADATVDETPLEQMTEEQAAEDATESLPDEERPEPTSEEIIIQAITEFDELIKETEKALESGYIETDSRGRITKAVEEATKLIKKAFTKDPIEGDSHEHTMKAIKKATKLIEGALEEDPGADTSQLRVKQK